MERNSNKDLILQMLAFADVCKIDVLKDFVKLTRKHFFAVHSNFTYDSQAYDLMKLYLETSHSESGQTIAVGLFFF